MNYAEAAKLARAYESVARVEALTERVAQLEARLDAADSRRRRTRKPKPEAPTSAEERPWLIA